MPLPLPRPEAAAPKASRQQAPTSVPDLPAPPSAIRGRRRSRRSVSAETLAADAELVRFVAGEAHVFSTAQAARAGLTAEALTRLARTGRVRRVTKGWYMLTEPGIDEAERHRRLVRALLRSHEGSVVASHHSALVLWNLPTFGIDWSCAHLTHRSAVRNRHSNGYVTHKADESVARLNRFQETVSRADAAVQAGLSGQPLTTLVAADHLLHKRLVTIEELREAAARLVGRHGVAAVVAMLDLVDAAAESPAETVARYIFVSLGVEVVSQYVIALQGRTVRGDFVIERERLLIEVDGRVKYEGKRAAEVIMDEKARHAALERAGWRIVRLTWADLVDAQGSLRLEHVRGRLAAVLGEPVQKADAS